MRTRTATAADIPGLKALWKQAFGDEDRFIDAFFDKLFRPEGCVMIEDEGRPISMAHLIPCTLIFREGMEVERFPALYLYGMATDEDHRGKGLGLMLLSFAKGYAGAMGFEAIALLPADEGLFRFYKKAGYEEFFEPQRKLDAKCYMDYTDAFIAFQREMDAMYGEDHFSVDPREVSGYRAMLRRLSDRLPYGIKGYMGLALE